ncbi:CHASE2 domain-containing protein [filamentous cyanobacterium LEGE 11480]|uniref:CHASE2 domain-containing protein n=1 Tax=Romeriopsis navalis LEGE 11480 TaxID=2777977 RepID=A0A928VN14_9CYAN|nr:CHASE2 domain-containing protein [Romeriopsis navalis]MBE9029407.1 CHASE2 domain-containing protein [Romeriopsis navalis LEGE 11480]
MPVDLPPPTETITPTSPAVGLLQRWRQTAERYLAQSGSQIGWAIGLASLSAIGVGMNPPLLQPVERQMQQQFWQVRGSLAPPADIVIVGIDANTLTQISGWPLDRSNYARVIDQLLGAGARGVAVDILFDVPRGPGQIAAQIDQCGSQGLGAGDQLFRQVLRQYGDRVTLATSFEVIAGDAGGALSRSRLVVPHCALAAPNTRFGSIDFITEGGQNRPTFHQLGHRALTRRRQQSDVDRMLLDDYKIKSFAQSALDAAKIAYPPVQGDDIYFYGGRGTFPTFSLADILLPDNWQSKFQSGEFFRNKLILIGMADDTQLDIVDTPLGRMAGVELHANAIATILQSRALRPIFPNTWMTAGIVFLAVLAAAAVQSQAKQPRSRFLWALGLSCAWAAAGFLLLSQASLLLPTVLPIGAIASTGAAYFGFDVARDQRNRKQLESSLKDRSRDPVVRDIINQQTDETLKQVLLEGRQQELLGARIGGGRYQTRRASTRITRCPDWRRALSDYPNSWDGWVW